MIPDNVADLAVQRIGDVLHDMVYGTQSVADQELMDLARRTVEDARRLG